MIYYSYCVVSHAEDNLVEAFWLIGEFQPEMHHCKVSLEVTVDWLFLASRVFFFFLEISGQIPFFYPNLN